MSGKVILGIHGLSNKPPAAQVSAWWEQSLLEGLRVNRQLTLPTVPFHAVYWADLLYPAPDPAPEVYTEALPGALKRYEDRWSDVVLAEALDIGGDVLWVLKRLTGMDSIAEGVLRRKLVDLYRYYTEPSLRDALRARLVEMLMRYRESSILLIAHSMGTIIAYDALRLLGRTAQDVTISHWVTIGSPLGLPHVKYQILREYPLMRTPSLVEQWSNFADRRDPVAVDVSLRNDYAANDRGVRVVDALVLNDSAGLHHAAYGYLRTPEVTDVVRAFL
jgi:hypothetical protein